MLPEQYFDEYGHIKQNHYDYDGGDSFSFAGQYMVSIHWQHEFGEISDEEYEKVKSWYRGVIADLYIGYGIFARHSRYHKWSTRWNRMSRDQTKANIYGMAIAGAWKHLFLMFLFLILRLGFTTNFIKNRIPVEEEYEKHSLKFPDFCGPDIWAMYLRSFSRFFNSKIYNIITYPFILVFDIQTYLNAILTNHMAKKDPKDANETNFICLLLQAADEGHTYFSSRAVEIYSKRPLAAKGLQPARRSFFGPQSALDYFFSGRNNMEPPIHEEFRGTLEIWETTVK